MYNIYNILYSVVWKMLLPSHLRMPRMQAWGNVLTWPIQQLHNFIFGDYANGSNYLYWDPNTSYSVGDRVVYTGRRVYECIQAIGPTSPDTLPTDATYWKLYTDNYIGARERVKYNSQKILFEYALNKWFQCVGIYITTNNNTTTVMYMSTDGIYSGNMTNDSIFASEFMGNFPAAPLQNDFTLFVPIAVYNSLDPNPANRENIIRGFADQFVIAGIKYNVQTY